MDKISSERARARVRVHIWYALIVIYKWFEYKYRLFPPKKIHFCHFLLPLLLFEMIELNVSFLSALISKWLRHIIVDFLFVIFFLFRFISIKLTILRHILTIFWFLLDINLHFRSGSLWHPKTLSRDARDIATSHSIKIIVHYVHFCAVAVWCQNIFISLFVRNMTICCLFLSLSLSLWPTVYTFAPIS